MAGSNDEVQLAGATLASSSSVNESSPRGEVAQRYGKRRTTVDEELGNPAEEQGCNLCGGVLVGAEVSPIGEVFCSNKKCTRALHLCEGRVAHEERERSDVKWHRAAGMAELARWRRAAEGGVAQLVDHGQPEVTATTWEASSRTDSRSSGALATIESGQQACREVPSGVASPSQGVALKAAPEFERGNTAHIGRGWPFVARPGYPVP